jgi:hypothetical protein
MVWLKIYKTNIFPSRRKIDEAMIQTRHSDKWLSTVDRMRHESINNSIAVSGFSSLTLLLLTLSIFVTAVELSYNCEEI